MDYKANEDMNIWLADKNGAPFHISILYFDSPLTGIVLLKQKKRD
ncbi:MAG: hypothetical protein R3A12_16945 [Ignavibacteria bacterium]